MFQDNLLLEQLKQKLHSQAPRAEGIVRATEKGFGFLEVDVQKSYFIPPFQMKKVMHGDRISAVIHIEKERESAEPEVLIEPFLTRFVGRVQKKENYLSVIPDHPLLKDAIPCRVAKGIVHDFKEGDWVIAEMCRHPLRDNLNFYAELSQFITFGSDYFVPWWVTLARHNLEKEAPNNMSSDILDEGLVRQDLTALNFITIDNSNTKDMDDALYAERTIDGKIQLIVAVADPTAWISEGSELDKIAKERAFSSYLPGLSIPMLPRELSDDICSLQPHEVRPALACRMIITADGTVEDKVEFFAASIESKAKLVYNEVSDWLENIGSWQPENEAIARQLHLLRCICLSRGEWRNNHALVFKDRPEYRFVLSEKGEVLNIIAERRRIANRIVEEAMIAANICGARILHNKLGFGIYNVHTGFDPASSEALVTLLKIHDIHVDPKEILTLTGFCQLRRELDAMPSSFLSSRVRRFQSFAEISTEPGPHFGLGLEAYATWTSPIRKYGDMINHRLLKAILKGESISRPQKEIAVQIARRRRLNRMAERDIGYWLYARFLQNKAGTDERFIAEIIDINRSGMRVQLVDNGAVAFVPALLLHATRDELICSQENGIVQIKGKTIYKITDFINVIIIEVRMETRNIIVKPIE